MTHIKIYNKVNKIIIDIQISLQEINNQMERKVNINFGGQPSTTHQVDLQPTIVSTQTPPYVNKPIVAQGPSGARLASGASIGYSNPVPVTATTVSKGAPAVNFQFGGNVNHNAQTNAAAFRTVAPYQATSVTMIRNQQTGRVASNAPVAATGFQTSDVRPGFTGEHVFDHGPVQEQKYYNARNFQQGPSYHPVPRQEAPIVSSSAYERDHGSLPRAHVSPVAPRQQNNTTGQTPKKKTGSPGWPGCLIPVLACLCCLLLLGLIFGLLCAFGKICHRGGSQGDKESANGGQIDIEGVLYDKNSVSIEDTVLDTTASSSGASGASGTSGTSGTSGQSNTAFQFPPNSTSNVTPNVSPVSIQPIRSQTIPTNPGNSVEPRTVTPVPTSTIAVFPINSRPVPYTAQPISSRPVPANNNLRVQNA